MFKIKEIGYREDWGFGMSVSSPHELDPGEKPYSNLHVRFWKVSIWIKIPAIVKARARWVDTTRYEWSHKDENGKAGYWDHDRREFGVFVDAEYLWLHYGVDAMNSEHGHNTKLISWPTNFEHVRHDAYYADGSYLCAGRHLNEWGYEHLDRNDFYHYKDWFRLPKSDAVARSHKYLVAGKYDNYSEVSVDPATIYKWYDYLDKSDGSVTVARVNIEEREWIRGRWAWLRFLLKHVPGCRIVQRCLDIEFKDEVGARKGSWKGGTIGMSTSMLPGETMDECMQRFQKEIKV